MRRARNDLIFLAAIALLTNFGYLYLSSDYFFPDSATYLTPARSLLHGHGFSSESGVAETFRTPGYPLFLLPFLALRLGFAVVVCIQHLLNVAMTLVLYRLTSNWSGSRFAALCAGIVFALDVPTIHYANKVLTETLFTACLLALFAVTVHMLNRGATPVTTAVAGLLGGALVLIRPVAIAYFFVLALFLFARASKRTVAAFLLLALALPVAWGIRNRVRTGVFSISTVAGTNMLLHRAAAALAIDEDTNFRADLDRYQKELTADADREIMDSEHVDDIRDVESSVRGQYYLAIGRRVALEHPVALAYVLARGMVVNFFDSDWEAIMVVSRLPGILVELALSVVPPIVIALAFIGLAGMWRRDRLLALLVGATVGYFLFMSAGSEAEARFRVPVMPLIAIAAGVGVETVRRGVREMRQTG